MKNSTNIVTENLKVLDAKLKEVSYSYLNSDYFKPSPFSLKYKAYMDMVRFGGNNVENKTPPFHMKMLDKLGNVIPNKRAYRISNMNFRGSSKTTLMGEYGIPYIAIFNSLPIVDDIDGMVFVGDTMENGVKNLRKNIEFRYYNSPFLQEYLPEVKFTDSRIDFVNIDNRPSAVRMFGANTNLRGIKILAKRPKFLLMDDILDQQYVDSPTYMARVFENVYEGAMPSLDPTNHVAILNGTPMRATDIIVSATASGKWDSNLYPICERFPCSREEFVGAWEDRFTYDYVRDQYELAKSMGNVASFYQEFMLQISSDDSRLVKDEDIRWFSVTELMSQRTAFNFYITTDFATSAKQHADYSVISVWALSSENEWFLVDGFCKQALMDETIDNLFRLARKYNPLSVGVEVTGQQGGFIQWIQREMYNQNFYFNLASSTNSGSPGIRPTKDKMTRFKMALPIATTGRLYFPLELKNTHFIQEFVNELQFATDTGFRGKDDCLDTFSQLEMLNAFPPPKGIIGRASETFSDGSGSNMWGWTNKPFTMKTNYDSYLV